MTQHKHFVGLLFCVFAFLSFVGIASGQAPTITGFDPEDGPGGTQVEITGTNFTGAMAVLIGGQPVHSFWVSSATTIVATVGSGATGLITVTTTTGTVESADPFEVTGPGVFQNAPNTASRVLGQANFNSMNQNQPTVQSGMRTPHFVAVDPTTGKVFVSDQGNHRVLRFASWGALTNGASPESVLGQADLTGVTANRGGTVDANTLNSPLGIHVDGAGRLWVADNSNARVLRFDDASNKADGANADGVLGQPDFTSNALNATAPNVIRRPYGIFADGGGRLWVSCHNSNRVHRFDDAANKADGADADGILGQVSFTASFALSGTSINQMSRPSSLAVDAAGRLWVAEGTGTPTGHRILRFDNAANKANGADADGVLGQADFDDGEDNRGGSAAANTLSFTIGLSVDGAGRLWVGDAGNNRVLRFDNAANKGNGAEADGVLGQSNFTNASVNRGGSVNVNTINLPYGVFADAAGRVWIADRANNRVLTYEFVPIPPSVTSVDPVSGAAGTQITITGAEFTGATTVTIGGQPVHSFWVSSPNTIQVVAGTAGNGAIEVRTPNGVGSGGNFEVTGPGAFENAANTAVLVLGQDNFDVGGHSGTGGLSQSKFEEPGGVAVDPTTGKVFVADAMNNRVLRYASYSALTNGANAEAVLGEDDFVSGNNGFVTARNRMINPKGLHVDGAGRLWVADQGNSRVLRFDDASNKATGSDADGVLGQPDYVSDGQTAAQNRMRVPGAVYVDGGGRLWVADRGNHRVLRFDNAAGKTNGANADAVFGQANYDDQDVNRGGAVGANTLREPEGVFVDVLGNLWVADAGNNRVLRYNNAVAKDNGADADIVLGQPGMGDDGENTGGRGPATLNSPEDIYIDGASRLWIADRRNNRVVFHENIYGKGNYAAADGLIGQEEFDQGSGGNGPDRLRNPPKLHVERNGRLWVVDRTSNRVLAYEYFPNVATITAVNPSSTIATMEAFSLTINGRGFNGTSTLTISALDSQGATTGTLNLLPFISSSTATRIDVDIPSGVAATVGTLTINLTSETGSTTGVFTVLPVPPPPSIGTITPNLLQATTGAVSITLTGERMGNLTALNISRLNESGLQVGTVDLLPFTSGTTPATSLTVQLPEGTLATGGTLTLSMTDINGTTTADLLVQSDNIVVTNANNDGGGSLRRAFELTSTGGTIQIQGSLTPIQLTGGPIRVDRPVSLVDTNGGLEINGNGDAVFIIECDGSLRLENVTLRNGANVPAIRNECDGTVRLRRVNVTGN